MTAGSVIIVGVGPNLGAALARAFAAAGHPVALLARDADALRGLVGELRQRGVRAATYAADAADPAALREALVTAFDELGPPEVLVYNAAMLREDTPTDGDDAGWAAAMAVDVLGAKTAAEVVLGRLPNRRGSLLFTGGGLAVHPSPTYASVSVGKAALRAYVTALHAHLAGSDVHATVVTIAGFLGQDQGRFAPSTVAQAYVDLHRQRREDWAPELVWE